MLAGRVSLSPVKQFVVAVGGEVGKLGQNLVGVSTPNTARRLDAVVAYVGSPLRIGVDGFYARDYSAAIVTGKASEDSAYGVSGWASLAVHHALTLFGRVDFAKPNRDTAPGVKDVYFNAGMQLKAARAVDLALVVKRDTVDSRAFTEAGLFSQYAF